MRHLLSCLSYESLRPSKLQKHLEKNHPGLKGKDIEYLKRLQNGLKRQRLDNIFRSESTKCKTEKGS